MSQHEDSIIGLHGRDDGTFKKEIARYMENHKTTKIITTYDSLPAVCNALSELDINPYSSMHLVIDE